jgi:hypothetical protein
MKYIKEYKEVKEQVTKVYVVILFDVGGFVNESFAFTSHMKAADKFIELVNENYDTDFEFYYEDGERLFSKVDENEDYEKAIQYVDERNESSEPNIEILDINLES